MFFCEFSTPIRFWSTQHCWACGRSLSPTDPYFPLNLTFAGLLADVGVHVLPGPCPHFINSGEFLSLYLSFFYRDHGFLSFVLSHFNFFMNRTTTTPESLSFFNIFLLFWNELIINIFCLICTWLDWLLCSNENQKTSLRSDAISKFPWPQSNFGGCEHFIHFLFLDSPPCCRMASRGFGRQRANTLSW